MTRFVICVDIAEDDLAKAYGHLHDYMDYIQDGNSNGRAAYEGWESSDEAFDADGEHIDPDVLQKAREKFFEERQK